MQNRSKLIEFLKQRGYKFHTYCPVSERRVDIVVKGLPHDDINYGNEIIMEEFKKWGFNPISARLINQPRDENAQLNGFANWHISLPNGTNTESLFKQKHRIGQCIVRIESLKKRSIVQCYNCLRFHLTATNCFHSTRCLICAGPHKANQCTQGKMVKPKCANCGNDHVATNLGKCQAYEKIVGSSKKFKEAIQIPDMVNRIIDKITKPKKKTNSCSNSQSTSINGTAKSTVGINTIENDSMLPATTPTKKQPKKKVTKKATTKKGGLANDIANIYQIINSMHALIQKQNGQSN